MGVVGGVDSAFVEGDVLVGRAVEFCALGVDDAPAVAVPDLRPAVEVGGAQESVCQVAFDPNDPYRAVWAPSWRLLGEPAREVEVVFLEPLSADHPEGRGALARLARERIVAALRAT